LISAAKASGAILQVGHIERFNPAVMEAARHIDHPQFIEVNRLGPYDPRVAEVGVILDLMIHDLDIVLFLVGEEVTRVEAFGAKVLSNHEDIAKVRLHFAGGCIADLSASRISIKKYRKIRIFQKNAYLTLDYAAPALQIYKKKGDVVKSLTDIQILKPRLPKIDPLAREQEHFLECVREGKTPLVSGQHGRDAIELAHEVLAKLTIHA
jgi:predicted dehydrogenase